MKWQNDETPLITCTRTLKILLTNRAEAAHGLGRPLVSVYSDYAGRCEVLRLLLLLLIEPTSQNIRDINIICKTFSALFIKLD